MKKIDTLLSLDEYRHLQDLLLNHLSLQQYNQRYLMLSEYKKKKIHKLYDSFVDFGR